MRALLVLALLAVACNSSREHEDQPAPVAPAAPVGLAPLLARVPADAFAIVAFDLDKLRGSAGLMTALDVVLRRTGLGDQVGSLAGTSAIAIAGTPRAPIVVMRTGAADVRVLGDRGAPAAGTVLLADALASVKTAPAGFGAIRIQNDTRAALAGLVPGLGKLEWIAGTLETETGIVLAANAVFPDATSAAAVAVSVSMAKSLAKSQLPAAAAVAVDKLAFTAMGNAIKISARWTEADVAGLVAETR